jgi:hypothetical protein
MSDSRAEFEAFAASIGHRLVPSTNPHVDYAAPISNHVWEFWKAARKAALEEAAKVCEAEALEDPQAGTEDIAYDSAVRDCAAAIRSLANRSPT